MQRPWSRIQISTTPLAKYYLIALIGVILATALRYTLGSVLGGLIPVVLFTVPVTISAIYGGFGPAIFATILSAAVANYFFIHPLYSFRIEDASSAVAVIVFLGVGTVISFLGKRLKELQAETEKQSFALAEENKLKDEFLAMLAHELRNPLAGISTAAELLKLGRSDEHRITLAGSVISRQVGHMVKLIDDLLDVSRLSRGLVIVEKRPVDMNDVVQGAIDQTKSLLNNCTHQLILHASPEPAYVYGEYTRLVQVVANLLSNAARYTPASGQIALKVDLKADEVEVSVQDNGLGIAPELLTRIFEPFVQVNHRTDRSKGGLGLGLAVVQKITQLHGGSVTVDSKGLGKGSVFTTRFPRLKNPSEFGTLRDGENENSRQEHTGIVKPLSIILVDDNSDALHGLASILEGQGHEVVVAYDAKQALDLARTRSFSTVLLDIGLPDIDGYELLFKLRQIPHLANAVFLAMSGYGKLADIERSKEAGFHHHFIKPVNLEMLQRVLNQISTIS